MLNQGKKIIIPAINRLGKIKEKKNFPDPPVLIGGCGRSGTTLLLSMLSAHPAIFAFPHELSIFNHWTNTSPKRPLREDRMYRYLLTHRIPERKRRWCEKTPYNVRYIESIFEYFQSNARFIHIIRDGRDVCLSKHPDKPGEYWVEPQRWINDVKAGLKFRDNPKVHTVFYENLVFHYQKYMQEVLDFLEEELTKEMQDWRTNTKVTKNNAWYGSVENLHSQSVAKWKQPENEKRVQELLAYPGFAELLKELNYDL